MTVNDLATKADFKVICMPDPEREICGAYIGDLLSWVMGRASCDDVWITIMSNINVLAVATLADVSCVILAESVEISEDIITTALDKKVNILSSNENSYKTAVTVSKLI